MGAAPCGGDQGGSGMAGWSVPGVVHLGQVREDPVGRRVIARHRLTRKTFAITYLSPEVLADAEFRARFEAECARVSRVRRSGIARVHRYVACDDGAAVVGEHINGPTLRSLLIAQGALGAEAALVILKDLLRALAACHQAGLAHGDVKPEHVSLTSAGTSGGRVRLRDFGLWTAAGRRRLAQSTPFYLAPEQWSGPAVSRPSSDVYAATVTFFECLAGAPPFYADDPAELAAKHQDSLVPIEVIPEGLRDLVLHGLAKDPRARLDARALLAAVGDVAAQVAGSHWERQGRRELGAHLSRRSTLAEISALNRRISGAGRVAYHRPVRLAAVMGGALALAAGLSSPPLAVIPGMDIFGSGERPPVQAFPEPDHGPLAMRVVTNGRPADRASTSAAKLRAVGPVEATRPRPSEVPRANVAAGPYDYAQSDLLRHGTDQEERATTRSTPDQFSRGCAGQSGGGDSPCTAVHPEQPAPGSAGSPADSYEVSIPVALPAPLPPVNVPVQLPIPIQLPVPVRDLNPPAIPNRTGPEKDFRAVRSLPSRIDSQVPKKMTVRTSRSDAGRKSFGSPRTLSDRGFGGSRGAGKMGRTR
jgi:tRNA A-37 threonylcarbamoyl transferase component Bud32